MDKRRKNEERVPEVDKIGRPKPNGDTVKRSQADNLGRASPIIFATVPILGERGNYIVEFQRNPNKDKMGGRWVPFLTEHQNIEDAGKYATMVRGFQQEVGYSVIHQSPIQYLNNPRRPIFYDDVYAPSGVGTGKEITFRLGDEEIRWVATPFVVPAQTFSSLEKFDEQGKLKIADPNAEIIAVRKRSFSQFRDDITGKKFPGEFEPLDFLYGLVGATQTVFDRWPRRTTKYK
jgi:hypothetical protein